MTTVEHNRPASGGDFCAAFEKGFEGHIVEANPGFLRVRMAVDQHQSLVWMLIHHQGSDIPAEHDDRPARTLH